VVGTDDLAAMDAYHQQARTKNVGLLLRQIVPGLLRFSPQGAVHFKTIYSVLNMVRRCPPAPIFAALSNNPDFENAGNGYWRAVHE
jgi:hypothetical protein